MRISVGGLIGGVLGGFSRGLGIGGLPFGRHQHGLHEVGNHEIRAVELVSNNLFAVGVQGFNGAGEQTQRGAALRLPLGGVQMDVGFSAHGAVLVNLHQRPGEVDLHGIGSTLLHVPRVGTDDLIRHQSIGVVVAVDHY